jgi:hypothetical protein
MRTVVGVTAASTVSAAVLWSALFYGAVERHAERAAAAPAPPARAAVSETRSAPVHTAPAPVTTRTS